MATDVILPNQGQSVETCQIIEWKVREGDTIQQGDVLCVMETDKATFEVESPADGTLLKIFFHDGEDAPVMTRIALIGTPGEVVPEGEQLFEKPPGPAVASVDKTPTSGSDNGKAVVKSETGKSRISPRARRMADLHNIPLENLSGSGPMGRIIVRDVEDILGRQESTQVSSLPDITPPISAATPVERDQDFKDLPVRSIRKRIAERMLQSVQSTAQYTLHGTAPATALLTYRSRLKDSPESMGLREVSINDLILFVTIQALRDFPELNSHFLGDRIRTFRQVHLGFAVDTPRGLMVPVIRNASSLTLRSLATEARRLREACLSEKIKPEELTGGTFTVSNLGTLGVGPFTPVLYPPQVAILGIGSIELKPVRRGENVEFVDSLNLSLTANHQIIDGAPGARFLQHVSSLLDQFELTLAG